VRLDGSIRNSYEMRLRNKRGDAHEFALAVTDGNGAPLPDVTLAMEGQAADRLVVASDATQTQRIYLTAAPGSALAATERSNITLWVEDITDKTRASVGTVFHGKEKK